MVPCLLGKNKITPALPHPPPNNLLWLMNGLALWEACWMQKRSLGRREVRSLKRFNNLRLRSRLGAGPDCGASEPLPSPKCPLGGAWESNSARHRLRVFLTFSTRPLFSSCLFSFRALQLSRRLYWRAYPDIYLIMKNSYFLMLIVLTWQPYFMIKYS